MSYTMSEWMAERLEEDDRVIVPLRELWEEWQALEGETAFDEFADTILRDSRFEHVYSITQDPRLEETGYFAGPRIMLRSKVITEQCLVRLIRSHHERIVGVLFRATEVLQADGGSGIQGELSEALQRLAELRPVLAPWTHLQPGSPPKPRRKRSA